MGKSIKKLSHASLHLFHKIGLIHVAIILMVVGIKIKGSPAILSILPISSLLLLLILLIGILIEVVVLVVKGPLWISILMVALMRLVPVVPRLLVLLYVRDSVIHSIDILAHKISISIVLDTVMVAVDSHRHLRSLVFKFVIIPVDLDAGPTILDHYSIAISTDRYHQGATLNKYLILIARNVDISTTILQSMLRIIVKNVHPRLIIIINIQQVSITPTHRNEMSLGGKGRLYTALKLEVYAQQYYYINYQIIFFCFYFDQVCVFNNHILYSSIMFTHTIEDFKQLFQGDNIRDGSSLKLIKGWNKTEGLIASLKTNIQNGLADDQATRTQRINTFGQNMPVTKPSKGLWQMIVESFEDEMLRILCLAAVVSLGLGIATEGLEHGWMEGTSILVAVVIIVTVTSGNNYVKQQQFKKLNAIASRKNVNVFRHGNVENISVDDLVVGDIQIIQTGEIISVDGLLVEAHNIIADQSSMTGEPLGIKKHVAKFQQKQKVNPFLISSSQILEGTGKMLVLAIGEHSQYGILKKTLVAEADQTPLQLKLTILAEQIGNVGMYASALTFICMLGHIFYGAMGNWGSLISLATLHELVQAFIISVTIIVVAVPEGLPLAVTIALAYSVGKMKDQNNLVRYLQACQTMGGADNICSDKTGTLTKNRMTVTKMFVQERTVDNITKGFINQTVGELFSVGVAMNSSANPIIEQINGERKTTQIGNKTDCALLEVAHVLGYDYRSLRKVNHDKIIKIVPFSSDTKTMSSIINFKDKVHVFSKGAPDFLLKNCTHYLDAKGASVPITEAYKNTLLGKLKEFADLTLRTLLIAYKVEAGQCRDEDVQKNLIIIGMVGIKDPLRQQVPHAVKLCNTAGVIVRMITGDNSETAIAIAKEAGILAADWKKKGPNDYTVMTGQQFRTFVQGLDRDQEGNQKIKNIENFKLVRDQLRVLARSSPTDKYIMATGLKQLHHVVAMTGDGTNDAPALKKADIGFAMGIAGTQVAKQASGIILLDDNFSSIVTAMKWGRNIFDSIRKFLQFQLTVNVCALILAFSGAAVLRQSPLSPIQMLWVNLIMDTLAALALATEPPNDDLLFRKPYSRFQNLITPDMWKNIISQGLLQVVVLGSIFFKGPQIFGIPTSIGVKQWNNENGKHYCMFFNTFVLMQVFNEINARKLKSTEINVFKNFFNNPLFFIIMILTLVVQYLCVQFGGQSLRTVPLTTDEHLICLGLGTLPLFFAPIFKLTIPSSIFQGLSKETKEQ